MNVPDDPERSQVVNRRRLVVAGLIPASFGLLAMLLWPVGSALVAVAAPVIANALVGRHLRRESSPRLFLLASGVAAAGWVLAVLVMGGIGALATRGGKANTIAQAIGIFAAAVGGAGLVLSPLAGAVSLWGRSRRASSGTGP